MRAVIHTANDYAKNIFYGPLRKRALNDVKHAGRALDRLPFAVHNVLNLADDFENERWHNGAAQACAVLRNAAESVRTVGPFGLTLSAGDDQIKERAESLAKAAEHRARQMMRDFLADFTEANKAGEGDAFAQKFATALLDDLLQQVAKSSGFFQLESRERLRVNDPVISDQFIALTPKDDSTISIMACARRLQCAKWWRRRLRTIHARWRESQLIQLGAVGRGKAIYSSDEAVQARREQRKRNDSLLHAFLAMDDDTAVLLSKCAEKSVSNPAVRRSEVMTRLRGTEEAAQAQGLSAHFWTLTAPSRFHRWKGGGEDNLKYEGATPRDAQDYLVGVWSRIRAALDRAGCSVYGFRVAEPHKDGCPHWHLLVFGTTDALNEARDIAGDYALKDSPDEPGAKAHRFTFEPINPAKGSAVGYVAKYISKNLDAQGMQGAAAQDTAGIEHGAGVAESIERVEAWRSLWGIRQFQFFAAGKVTIWRELRRLKARPDGPLAPVWETAQGVQVLGEGARADWAAFLDQCERVQVGIAMVNKPEPGEYGEPVQQITGLTVGSVVYVTRQRFQIIARREALRLGLVSITVRGDGSEEIRRLKAPPDIE